MINPISTGGVNMTPLSIFQNCVQTTIPKRLQVCDFKFLPFRQILKKISGQSHKSFLLWRHPEIWRCKYYGQVFIKGSKIKMPIESDLEELITWNSDTILVLIDGIQCKKNFVNICLSSLFFYCSLLFSNNRTIELL